VFSGTIVWQETIMIKPPPKDFFQWLDARLHDADLTDYALAQKAGITHSVISRARSGQQGIGYEAGVAIAQALDLPPEIVLRKLELLPPAGPNRRSVLIDEMLSVFPDLSDADQEELLQLARLKLERKKREARGKKTSA
jgi:transcriptional regulator with XRE-family HTH domain